MTTRLYINDIELDITKNLVFPLTYRIADVKEPEKRKRNASKTITLPGTERNNTFFQSAYDLNISDVRGDSLGFDFDPTLRYNARVVRNGSEIFRGSANLTTVVQKDKVNSFQVLLYSEITNLFQALGDTLVSELGWSEYDHDLTIANIQTSWSAATGSSYWYPLIDFGFSADPLSYLTNELRPYVYVLEIVQKCFELAGNTLSSTFFNSTRIKKLAFGYGGGEQISLTSSEIAARQANYTGDGTKTHVISGAYNAITQISTWLIGSSVMPFSDNTTVAMTQVTDTNAQFNESTGELVVFNSGSYRLNITGVFPVTYSLSTPYTGKSFTIAVSMRIFKNGAFVAVQQEDIQNSVGATTNLTFDLLHEMDLDAGDVITSDLRIDAVVTGNGFTAGSTFDLDVDLNNTLDYDFTALNVALVDGDAVQLSRFIPKMKASDFMKDMITMFNLYMGDPDDDGVVLFEPIDDYYFGTDDVDQWSEKLDRSSKIEIAPAANIKGKIYAFKWAFDEDYYKKLYMQTYGEQYGDYDYNVPSTFKKGEKVYQLKIAQSVPVQLEGVDIIIPRIIKVDEGTMLASPHKGKPRLFFNNGLIASDNWDLVNSDTGAITANASYPQAHHIDDLTTPTFDLNFGVPQWVYYTATAYTTNNLFSEYNAQFIRELTGRDSKIVNAFFKLNENDLYTNFMRRLCNIDGVLYRKNEVKDFRTTSNEVTKVELVKIVTGNTRSTYTVGVPVGFEPAMNNTDGGADVPLTDDTTVKSYVGLYIMDSSSKDLVVTLPADDLKAGYRGSVKKVSAGGKITLTPTGGGPAGTSIDGSPTLILIGKNDNVDFMFDGEVFKIV